MASRYVWITNGKYNKLFKRSKTLPEGWAYGRAIHPFLLPVIANDVKVGIPLDSLTIVETGGNTRLPRCEFCGKPVVGRKFHPECPRWIAIQKAVARYEQQEAERVALLQKQAAERAVIEAQRAAERAALLEQRAAERAAERSARLEQRAIDKAEQRAAEAEARAEQRALERLSTGGSTRQPRPYHKRPHRKPRKPIFVEPPRPVISDEEWAGMNYEQRLARLIANHNASVEAALKAKKKTW